METTNKKDFFEIFNIFRSIYANLQVPLYKDRYAICEGKMVFSEIYKMLHDDLELANLINTHTITDLLLAKNIDNKLIVELKECCLRIIEISKSLKFLDKKIENEKISQIGNLQKKQITVINYYFSNDEFGDLQTMIFFKLLFKVEIEYYFNFVKTFMKKTDIFNQGKDLFFAYLSRYEKTFIYIYLKYNKEDNLIKNNLEYFKEINYILEKLNMQKIGG
jgi:hypothetical protein